MAMAGYLSATTASSEPFTIGSAGSAPNTRAVSPEVTLSGYDVPVRELHRCVLEPRVDLQSVLQG
ncbi:MAG: hypothetical protein ACJAZO_004406 [Myxococcota bacterium]|jgi:hypothetical protein